MRQRGLARQRGEDVPARYEFKIVTKDGKEKWLDYAANAIQYEGVPAGLGIAFDVTDRKNAEEKLKRSELCYRSLFNALPNPIWLFDIDTKKILQANDAAVDRYGYSREEFLSMVITDLGPQDEVQAVEERLKRMGEKDGIDEAGIWKHKKKNGAVIDVNIVAHPLECEGRNTAIFLATEVRTAKRNN